MTAISTNENDTTAAAETGNPASVELTSAEAVKAARLQLRDEYKTALEADETRINELKNGVIKLGGTTMRVYCEVIGSIPEGGYPVYIALHGGGSSDTPDMNDSQWEMMKSYYKSGISDAIYVAPRGIADTWNTHFMDNSYSFYDRIIEDLIVYYNADPNRIYLMGFSAGGDGVYAISPRMADRFAAVNMSAGHPNGVSMANMYNLPIFIQCGEVDTAYDRNLEAARYDEKLGKLAATEGGYIHRTFIHAGKPHNFYDNGSSDQKVMADVAAWLENNAQDTVMADTNAPRLVSQYTRNALPERVIWDFTTRASARGVESFYWLSSDCSVGSVTASYDTASNTVTIEKLRTKKGTLTVLLSEEMVNLFKPVTIVMPDGSSTQVELTPSYDLMRETLNERGDPGYCFAASLSINCADGSIIK